MSRATAAILILVVTFAVPGHGHACVERLSGIWEARLQPDEAKIDQMLRRQGLAYLVRLVIAPQVSAEVSNSVMTLHLDPAGRFRLLQSGAKSTPGNTEESGTCELLEDGGDQVLLRMTSLGTASNRTQGTQEPVRVRILRFFQKGPSRLVGDARDWADAPFAPPTFVRRQAR